MSEHNPSKLGRLVSATNIVVHVPDPPPKQPASTYGWDHRIVNARGR
jgi:hypothetical protein